MYLHHPHKMNKQTLRSRHFRESSQHWKKHENPGASWSPGLETDINSRIWEPVNDLVQRLDHRLLVKFLLQESCVRSPCCFKTIFVDVDRTLYYTIPLLRVQWLELFWRSILTCLDDSSWVCMFRSCSFSSSNWLFESWPPVIHVDQLQVMYPPLRWTFTSWAAVVSSLRRSAWAWGRMVVQSLARSMNGDYCNMETLPANTWITPSKTGLWF